MTIIMEVGRGSASMEDLAELPDAEKARPFLTVAVLACQRAVEMAQSHSQGLVFSNTGVAFLTQTGERFPSLWASGLRVGKRLTAHQFTQAIHNAAPGKAAIALGLKGPQIVLTAGDIELAARIQISSGRAVAMLVCRYEFHGLATCSVITRMNGQTI